MDFVFPYVSAPEVGNKFRNIREIQLAVSSIKKYCKDSNVHVIGDYPHIKNINYIQTPRIKTGGACKRAFDITNKLLKAIECKDISNDFVYCYDDIIFLRLFTMDEISKPIAYNYIHNLKKYGFENVNPAHSWMKMFNSTYNILFKENLSTWNYETHIPRVFNKGKLNRIINKYDLTRNGLLISTLYYNNYYDRPYTTLDDDTTIRGALYKIPKHEHQIKEQIKNKLVLNYNSSAFNDVFVKFMFNYLK